MNRGGALLEKLGDRLAGLRGRMTPNAEMDKITWFRAGGLADALYQPADEEDLAAFLKAVPQDVPITVVGIGSNLLVREGGIPGFVVRLSAKGFGEAEMIGPNRIILSNADMGYAYRHSAAPKDYIFTSAVFEGHPEDRETIKAAMAAVQNHRETVQPIREKTGGSTFKNPEGTSAWKEIDKAGCRGLMIGGAQMSPLHCNFMINTGTATGYDLEHLGETVRARVLENSGIRLQWEIKRIGNFKPGHEVQEFLGQLL